MSDLQNGILSALAYYDGFGVPLTPQEIFLALPASAGTSIAFATLSRALAEAVQAGRIGSADGFHFLPGRGALVRERRRCYGLAEGKYRRVRRFLRLARFTPFLRAVFVCNTLARSYARAGSDIDLFLVAEPGRIWFARLCVTGLATLLGVRPTEAVSADRICLSFFVTSDALDLQPLAIRDDVYLAHWLRELYPMYDEARMAERLFVDNAWCRGFLPQGLSQTSSSRRQVAVRLLAVKRRLERWINAIFGDRLEAWARRLQSAWLPPPLKAAAASPDSDVVLTDTILKFHDKDRRAEIRDAYRTKLAGLLGVPTGAVGGAEAFREKAPARAEEFALHAA